MNPSVGAMVSDALVFVGTGLLAALLVAALYLVSRNTMRRLPPATRAGLLRPQVYLSSRLLSELSTSELGIIVQHEQAHRRRRDALRLLTADPPPNQLTEQ